MDRFWSFGLLVIPTENLRIVANDPDDDRILECALAANANVIVSGDQHLLKLGRFRTISITTPRQFLGSHGFLGR